jgi:hypothetical protein
MALRSLLDAKIEGLEEDKSDKKKTQKVKVD